jgi:NAD(P)-dependent dehydrogenase (short-subunit alcohol dehydrogenase family)
MKNVAIIGGSSGIGLELVKMFEVNSWNITSTYYSNRVENRDRVRYMEYDAKTGALDENQFPEVIDGLIYCPGLINLKQFHRVSPEEFLHDYNIQVLGAVKSIQALLPQLKRSTRASIVLFSSIAATTGFKYHSIVSSSKGALEGLVKSLAAEFAPTIRVNAIAPSLTNTPLAGNFLNSDKKKEFQRSINPLQNFASTSDIASMAYYLTSGNASFITGQIIHVDGGMSTLLNP